jgi:hypothetical protein
MEDPKIKITLLIFSNSNFRGKRVTGHLGHPANGRLGLAAHRANFIF